MVICVLLCLGILTFLSVSGGSAEFGEGAAVSGGQDTS